MAIVVGMVVGTSSISNSTIVVLSGSSSSRSRAVVSDTSRSRVGVE